MASSTIFNISLICISACDFVGLLGAFMSSLSGMIFRALLVLSISVFILSMESQSVLAATEIQGGLALEAGYRLDSLCWNIAGDSSGHNPDVLSELSWRHLQISQVKLSGSAENDRFASVGLSPYMRGTVGFGLIVNGRNQDSDYRGDDRTREFSRYNNSAGGGNVIDLSLAGGGKASFGVRRYFLAPLLGFSYYGQNLRMRDGNKTLSDDPASLGPIPGLNSTYEAAWYGPWLGFDASAVVDQSWTLVAGIEWHLVSYRAVANWNLRSDLAHPKSFEHTGDGDGLIWRLEAHHAVTPRLKLMAGGEWRDFSIHSGRDRLFFADGQQESTRLNEVQWRSKSLMAGLKYFFY